MSNSTIYVAGVALHPNRWKAQAMTARWRGGRRPVRRERIFREMARLAVSGVPAVTIEARYHTNHVRPDDQVLMAQARRDVAPLVGKLLVMNP